MRNPYNLESVELPKLSGWGLQAFSTLASSSPLKGVIQNKLLKDAGIEKFRNFYVEQSPMGIPSFSSFKENKISPDKLYLNSKAASMDHTEKENCLGCRQDFIEAYRSKKLTPVTVATKLIAAIKVDLSSDTQSMNIFIASDEVEIMALAEASTARWLQGKEFGPWDGVPIVIKDELDQRGYPTTVGTTFLGKEKRREDATVVSRFREQGALLLGKANMHEIGINPNGFNGHYGAVRNPYESTHDAGGSSSGSAAAVAAGFCPVAVGADGGGSIRIPASYCGVIGLKPTFGAVSEWGAAPLCQSVAHIGPLCQSVADAALAFELMKGIDQKDPNTWNQPEYSVLNWERIDSSKLRIGYFEPWLNHCDEEISVKIKEVLSHYEKLGAKLVPVTIPCLDEMRIAHIIIIFSEMAANLASYKDQFDEFSAPVKINMGLAQTLKSSDYIKAQRVRANAMDVFADIFKTIDVLISPSTGVVAPKIGEQQRQKGWSDLSTETEATRFAFPGNLTGLPAISFPVGYNQAGLPIGMQAMAAPWHESLLFKCADMALSGVKRKAAPSALKLIQDE